MCIYDVHTEGFLNSIAPLHISLTNISTLNSMVLALGFRGREVMYEAGHRDTVGTIKECSVSRASNLDSKVGERPNLRGRKKRREIVKERVKRIHMAEIRGAVHS
jgi:hypothetical protein